MVSGAKPALCEKTTVFKSLGKPHKLLPGHKLKAVKGEVDGFPSSVGEWLGNRCRVHHLDQSFTYLGGAV